MFLFLLVLLLIANVVGLYKRNKDWTKIFMIVQVSAVLLFIIGIDFSRNKKELLCLNQTVFELLKTASIFN